MIFQRRWTRKHNEIDPDEIFLDASNLPHFDTHQFQGRLEKAISKNTMLLLGVIFLFVFGIFTVKLFLLQVQDGNFYARLAENNRLERAPLFPERGIVVDRNGNELIWNESFDDETRGFSKRVYTSKNGFAHILGYVSYPSQDSSGFYINEEFVGHDGVEEAYNDLIAGTNGLVITERDALGDIASEGMIRPLEHGKNLILSIDVRLQEEMYAQIRSLSGQVGFNAGAGVIIDVHTGEILTLTSFPEYDSNTLSSGSKEVERYVNDERNPFLNRAVSGLYTPGSIVKPIVALSALNEKVITPEEKILSTGSISIPNPYFPDRESVFVDWKAHGFVDVRKALAVSSNVYFYEVGGGYKNQEGVGIERLEAYFKLLGFGEISGIDLAREEEGLIPTPNWKERVFNDEWRIGDTYNTSIGQYGFQITALQAVRAIAAIANDGALISPHLLIASGKEGEVKYKKKNVPIRYISKEYYKVVREGMRMAVTEGTAAGLNVPYVAIGAKTGTAEVGTTKKSVNSWVVGFFPYENPRYAFAVVMERGPSANLIGGLFIMRGMFDFMARETPEYLEF